MSVARLINISVARGETSDALSKKDLGVENTTQGDGDAPATAVDYLVAVIPVEILALYTALVTALTALVPADAESWDEKHLTFRFVAMFLMVAFSIATILVGFYRAKSAENTRRFPTAEAIAVTIASLGWGLTTPGSPFLDVYPHDGFYDGALPLMIAFVSAGILTFFAAQLKKPASK